ncbi:spore germination protein [Paenibacillus sp. PK3_47]|uniref:spore germination protein n=1 Tax=Paenibacillus sp. PK3_47 TaxID=2072642 RepID=UPI00201DC731|nr:spore germination protein [Paenibacillus sp. PK3_47]UQZ37720.1 spore germination protein [Paenibacillus sp. PK3_47]
MGWIKKVAGTYRPNKKKYKQKQNQHTQNPQNSGEPIDPSLPRTRAALLNAMGNSPDFIMRDFTGNTGSDPVLSVCYLEGLTDSALLSDLLEGIIQGLACMPEFNNEHTAVSFFKNMLPAGSITVISTREQMYQPILTGSALIMIDSMQSALAVSIAGGERRAVEEPTSQTVIRGPKEGFTEEITTNITLIRRKIRTPDLRLTSHTIGEVSQTKVIVAYIEQIADPEVVKEINKRLQAIQTDSILESGYIEEFIQDAPLSVFPTMLNTERPDTVAGSLLDGQVAILVDGTPFALIAPVTFFNFFQNPEDYYQRYDISSFLRIIRMISFFISLLLPSVFIALTTFQQEMIPTTMLVTLAAQRESSPFPALLEALAMELTFEVIREAGVRMPRAIGPAISIVGALVIGQAAVEAGLVSGAMVIVVAFTAISNFVIPYFSMATSVRLLRFFLMVLAGTLGLFGILVGVIPVLAHLVSLQSFGVDYMTPYSPFYKSNMKDLVLRVPWWAMKTRPHTKSGPNRTRQASHQYPAGSNNIISSMKETDPQEQGRD